MGGQVNENTADLSGPGWPYNLTANPPLRLGPDTNNFIGLADAAGRSCINSAPTPPPTISSNFTPLAPGENQILTVTGGSASTSNADADSQRKVVGQIPGTSIVFNSKA